jgi:uncharacterized membrane protein YccF (DUF307 family)
LTRPRQRPTFVLPMSQPKLDESARSAAGGRISRAIRIGWFLVGGLWGALCLVVFVGGCVTSATETDSYVDGGGIASVAAVLGLVVGGTIWLLGYLVIAAFSPQER